MIRRFQCVGCCDLPFRRQTWGLDLDRGVTRFGSWVTNEERVSSFFCTVSTGVRPPNVRPPRGDRFVWSVLLCVSVRTLLLTGSDRSGFTGGVGLPFLGRGSTEGLYEVRGARTGGSPSSSSLGSGSLPGPDTHDGSDIHWATGRAKRPLVLRKTLHHESHRCSSRGSRRDR